MVRQSDGKGDDRERWIGVTSRRKHRAARDIQVCTSVDAAIRIDHASSFIGVHAGCAHVMPATGHAVGPSGVAFRVILNQRTELETREFGTHGRDEAPKIKLIPRVQPPVDLDARHGNAVFALTEGHAAVRIRRGFKDRLQRERGTRSCDVGKLPAQ